MGIIFFISLGSGWHRGGVWRRVLGWFGCSKMLQDATLVNQSWETPPHPLLIPYPGPHPHIPPSPDAIYGPIQSRGCVTKQTNRCPSHSRGFLNCLCYTYATHRGQMLTSIQSKTSYGTMQRRFEGC